MDFKSLFAGAKNSHGIWNPEARSPASTKRYPATDVDWGNHFAGVLGLGVVPVREDGTCVFGAIDIDDDSINHRQLVERVKKLALPLWVFRSKSGGAHCYLFCPEPGRPAVEFRKVLRRYAQALGLSDKTEIFPKQDKISGDGVGNWINLPYFNISDTRRYAHDPETGEILSYEKFCEIAKPYDAEFPLPTVTLPSDDGIPPCLEILKKEGIPEGKRNNALFNFGVYYKRRDEETWKDELVKANDYCHVPIPSDELLQIARSLSRTDYKYTCDQEPIVSICNKTVCYARKYGITNVSLFEQEGFDALERGQLVKVNTVPPTYFYEICGVNIEFDSDTLFDYKSFRKRVWECADKIIPNMKQKDWEQSLCEVKNKMMLQPAPEDVSKPGMIRECVQRFIQRHSKIGSSHEELLYGQACIDGKYILFRGQDLIAYIRNQRITKFIEKDAWMVIKQDGGEAHQVRVNGKVVRVWAYPFEKVNMQTEPFKPTEFEKSEF